MKNFKKVIKEALTPHYLRESVNEDIQPLEVEKLSNEALLDMLNNIDDMSRDKKGGTYDMSGRKMTRAQYDLAKSVEAEVRRREKERGLKIHYVDNERYEFMESVNEVTKEEIDDIENSGNIDIAYKKAMKLLNSLKDESVNESNWEKKLSKKAVHVDDDVYKKNKTQLQAAVKAYDKAESEGDIRGMELALAAVDMLKDESVNENLIKEFQRDGGNYRSSYQHRQPKEQLTTTEDYELFMEMFPRAEASRILMDPKRKELYDKHLEWTKEYDNNNTFVHMQYHEVEHEGEKYKVHQDQFYNGNYDDFRNPRFTELMISKDGKRMGTYLVDTGEYIEDLKNLEVKNKVSESLNEDIVDDKAKVYWLQKFTKGEIDTLPDNPRMEYLRHAMRDQLAQDKEQLSRERNDLSKSSSLIGRMGDRNLEESVNEGYLERAIEDEKDPKKLAMLKAKKEFYDNNPKEKRREMSDDKVGDEVRRLLKRNFMDEAEDRINELFGIGGPSHRDIKNKAARERSANKTANYHDLLKYYQFGIARIPRHKREKATVPQAMHDRYGQEVWDILKKAYPNKGLSDTPPSDWRDSADELIMALGDEGNFEKTIYNPFYDIYAKLGPTDSHKKQLGIEEVVRGDDFRFIDIKDLHFEIDPDRLEDMKIEFGAKMGGITNREKIEDAEYELRRFRKSINYGNGTSVDPFIPDSYDALTSKLVNGPHAKKRPKVNWNDRKYEEWIESVAAHGGVDHAYDMAQNAKQEQGLIDWVKKNRLGFGDVTALERIQYDIEALAESATGGGPVNPINLTIDDEGASDAALDSEVNHMFEEDLAENNDDEKFTIMLDDKGKFIIGMATDKHARSKEAGPFDTQKEACKFYNDKKDILLKNLTENNRLDEFLSNKYKIIGDVNSACAIDESKEFNFNKMIKEALTPNYLK